MTIRNFQLSAQLALSSAFDRTRKMFETDAALDARRLDIEGLEDRLLMSASPAVVAAEAAGVDALAGAQPSLDQLLKQVDAAVPAQSTSECVPCSHAENALAGASGWYADVGNVGQRATDVRELVFVDRNVPDVERLVEDLNQQRAAGRAVDLVLLDDARDGVDQISDALAQYSDLEAVHIVSHGDAGEVWLGSTRLNLSVLGGYVGEFAKWGQSLSSDADILFYGCDLAANDDGQWLMDAISVLSGADVAASTDATGHERLGGDWQLEFATGNVTANTAFTPQAQDEWLGLLNSVTFQEGSNGYSSTDDTMIKKADSSSSFGPTTLLTVQDVGGAGEEQALIRFGNLFGNGPGLIPYGSTINSAQLVVNVTDPAGAGDVVSVHRMLIPFTETSTWGTLGSGVSNDDIEATAAAVTTLSNATSSGATTISGLESTVQLWANGVPNYGLVFKKPSSNSWGFLSSETATVAQRPQLMVTYTPPPTLRVDTTSDVLDGDTSSISALIGSRGTDGKISLREAIIAANNTAGTNSIELPAGTYTLAQGSGDDSANNGDLDLLESINIIGASTTGTIIDGAGLDRVFDVHGSSTVSLSNLTIQHGDVSNADGGGLRTFSGSTTTLDRVVVADNSARNGGGVANLGVLNVADSTIQRNTATNDGGGLDNHGTVAATSSTFSENSADMGGAIAQRTGGSNTALTNVTISGNSAVTKAGAIFTNQVVTIRSSTIAFNSGGKGVGGLDIGNASTNAVLENTLLANNVGGNVNRAVTSNGHNFDTDSTAGLTAPTDISNEDARLAALADNGGLTMTHALLVDSPAINAGLASGLALDQRGFARTTTADIGAFEYASRLTSTVESRVNSTTTDVQFTQQETRNAPQSISISPRGETVVVWSSNLQDGSAFGIYGQRYAASGAKVGGEFLINQTTASMQLYPAIEHDAYGNFVVVWNSMAQDGSFEGVYARRFDASGSPLTGDIAINATTTNAQKNASLAVAADGSFVVAWEGNGPGDTAGIFYRRFNADGSAIDNADQLANANTQGSQFRPAVAMNADKDFVIVWDDSEDVWAQRYHWDGSKNGTVTQLDGTLDNARNASVEMAADGSLVVAFQSYSLAAGEGIFAQRVDALGDLNGAVITVSDATGDQVEPSIAVAPTGEFFVSWSGTGTGDTDGVFVRKFAANGSPLGNALLVNRTTTGTQSDAAIALLDDGNFAVAWSGNGPGDTDGIFFRAYGSDPVATVGYTATGPTIDSTQDAIWSSTPSYTIGNTNSGSVANAADLSASWSALWTTSGLYVLTNVTDDSLVNDSGSNAFADDIVQVFIDSNQSRGTSYDGANDFQFGFRYGDNTVRTGTSSATTTTGINFTITTTSATSYRLETLIPFSTLGISPVAGQRFGIDVQVGDDDVADSSGLTGQLAWADPVNEAATSAALFGTAELLAQPSVNVPPIANAGGPYVVDEGASITLLSDGSIDTDGAITSYEWDFDYDGVTFNTDATGATPTFSAASLDGPTSRTVGLRVTDNKGAVSDIATATVSVVNVSPTATDDSGSGYAVASNATLTTPNVLLNDTDPSSLDSLTVATFNTSSTLGLVTNNGNGTFTYNPNGAFNALSLGQTATDSFTYTISDGDGGSSTATVTLTINGVNDAPVITSNGGGASASVSIAENSTAVTTVTATDADLPSQTLSYSISGGLDAAKFSINSSSGALSFVSAPNFEVPTDSNTDNVYEVTVQVSDGSLTDNQAIAVTVTAVNDNTPSITSNGAGASASVSIAENSSVVTTVTATDADMPSQTLSYSISGGLDAAKFSINSTSGALSFVSAPNFEAPSDSNSDNVYEVTVQVSDGSLTDTQAISVTVTAVNDNSPTITSNGGGASASVSIAENSSVVTTVTATDADLPSQTLSYSISGGLDAAKFSINSTSGALSFVSAPNFEAPTDSNADNVYEVTVQVSDGSLTDTQAISVTVTAVNDNSPTITSNGGGASASVSIAENSTAVTTVTASDADLPSQTLSYSISGGLDAAKFSINSTSGALSFVSAPNFEVPTDSNSDNVYEVTVQVSDGALTDTQAISVTVTAVNDNSPTITSNGGGALASVSIAENSSVVTTVTATDADLPPQTLSYSISGGLDAAKFSINSTSGALSFVSAPNFEAPTDSNADNIYEVIVRVSDGSLTDTQSLNVTVTNANDVAPVITAGQTFSVSETASVGTSLGSVVATDADGATTYSNWTIVGGNTGGVFSLNATTGELTVSSTSSLNHAATPSYTLTLTVSDGVQTSVVQPITINLQAATPGTPNAVNDSYSVDEGGTLNQSVIANWFNTNWKYRQQIVFDNSASASNLTNTDVLIRLHASAADAVHVDYSQTQDAGQDLRFVDSNGNLLAYEIEQWDETGYSFVWVKVPQINAGSTTDFIHMYYGNSTTLPGETPAAVWDASDVAVFHMNGSAIDSTSNGNDGGVSNVVLGTGQIAGAGAFNGTSSFINAHSNSSVDNVFAGGGTVSAWIRPTGWGEGGFGRILDKGTSSSSANGWGLQIAGSTSSNGYLLLEHDFTLGVGRWRTAAGTLSLNNWQHVVVTYDNTLLLNVPKVFINGVEVSVTTSATPVGLARSDAAQDLYIGNRSGATDRTFDGNIDEVRLSTDMLTRDQIVEQYKSGRGTFATAGLLESGPGGVLSNDTDPTDLSLTVSLVSGPAHAASFTLNPDGSFQYIHDGTETSSDSFIYQITNGSFTDTATVTLAITPVNDQTPVITSNGGGATASLTFAENTTAVTTVTATDADLPTPTLSYSISGGADAARFAINSSTGALSFVTAPDFDAPTDANADNVYDVIVQVSDGSLTDSQTLSVTITGLNDNAPIITSNGGGDSVIITTTENKIGVTTVTATDADRPTPTLTYSIIGGVDGGLFTINSTTGVLQFNSSPNFENPTDVSLSNRYFVSVQVTDGTNTDTQNIRVDVTNLNEAPTMNSLSFTLPENSANGTVVGTVTSSDVDAGDTATYSIINGNAAGGFAINSTTGQLTVAKSSVLDFETSPTFNLQVRVTDSGGLTSSATVTINLTNINDVAPVAADDAFSTTEDAPLTVGVGVGILENDSDIEGGSLNAALVTGPTHGALSLNSDGSFSYTPDADYFGSDSFTYRANDGLLNSNTATVTIAVNAVNDAPTVTVANSALSYSEQAAPLTIDSTLTIADIDSTNLTGAAVTITNGTLTDADELLVTLTGGITGSFNAATDTLTLSGSASVATYQAVLRTVQFRNLSDTPFASTRSIVFDVTDGTLTASDSRSLAVTPINDAPTISIAHTHQSFVESGPAVVVDPVLTVADVDSLQIAGAKISISSNFTPSEDTLSFTPSGSITGSYNAATGVLSLSGTGTLAEYQTALRTVAYRNTSVTPNSLPRTIQFEIYDGAATGSDSRIVDISLTNEAPTLNAASFSLNENSANGTLVGTMTGQDVDTGDSLTYSLIGGNTFGAFAINATTGEITVANSAALDFETTPTFNLTIRVTDSGNLTSDAAVTVSLINRNEAPVAVGFSGNINENASKGAVLGTVSASDPDSGDVLSYSLIGGNTNGAFTINSKTGMITVAKSAAINFETSANFTLSVRTTDSNNLTSDTSVTIAVSNANEAPTLPTASFSLAENSALGTVVGTITGSDPDASDVLSYSIVSGNTNGAFTINATTGALLVANPLTLDFETTPTFNLVIRATDTGGLTADAATTVTLLPQNEAPTLNAASFNIAENSANGTLVGTVSATDLDAADSLTYSIQSGNTNGAFAINATTGAISVANRAALNFETTPTFNLSIRATDSGGLSHTATTTITLTNSNEAPTMNSGSFSLVENSAVATIVGTVTATDPDAGDTRTFALISGNSNGAFAINASTGAITVANSAALDFESTPTFSLLVRATDSGGLSSDAITTISLANRNEAPQTTGLADVTTTEDTVALIDLRTAFSDPDSPSTPLTFGTTSADPGLIASSSVINGILHLTPAPNADGTTVITVTARDPGGLTVSTSFHVTFTAVNDAPAARNDQYLVTGSGDYVVAANNGVLRNDSDVDHDPLTATILTAPSVGSVTFNADGSFTFTPPGSFSSVSFTYSVTDGILTSTATVTLQGLVAPAPISPATTGSTTTPTNTTTATDSDGTNNTPSTTPKSTTTTTSTPAAPSPTGGSSSDDSNKVTPFAPPSNPNDGSNTSDDNNKNTAITTIPFLQKTTENGGATSDRTSSLGSYASNSRAGVFQGDSLSSQLMASLRFEGEDMSYLADASFLKALDRADQRSDESDLSYKLTEWATNGAVVTTTGLSVGYILWLIRGGYVLASVVSTMPVWQNVDPLPVLDALNDDDEDDESLETMIEKAELKDSPPNEPPPPKPDDYAI